MRLAARDRRQQILQVALGLFARQGYPGTTTRQIAEEAGISEAILFRHFRNKEELYWAVIDNRCRVSSARRRAHAMLERNSEDRAAFIEIAREILNRNSADPTMFRLMLYTALGDHRLSQRFFRSYLAARYQELARHIRKRMRQGRFRPMDPVLAARGFLGMIIYHFLVQEIFGGKRIQSYDHDQVAAALTDIWLQGMQTPRRAPAASANGHAAHGDRRRSPGPKKSRALALQEC